MVVPLTSALNTLRFPGPFTIQPTSENGLTLQSLALVFQIRTADLRSFIQPMGTVEQAVLDEIWKKLEELTQ